MGKNKKFADKELFGIGCPVGEVLGRLTSRWGSLVMVRLGGKTLRFSELRESLPGISEKMLAQTLKQLEEDGFVNRVSYPVVPPKVEYSLTSTGEVMSTHVTKLANEVVASMHDIHKAQKRYAKAKSKALEA